MVWTGSRRCRGSEFHVIGPTATEKARRLSELVRSDGTTNWRLAAERRWCVESVAETGALCAARYTAAVPSRQRHMNTLSLLLTAGFLRSVHRRMVRGGMFTCQVSVSNVIIPVESIPLNTLPVLHLNTMHITSTLLTFSCGSTNKPHYSISCSVATLSVCLSATYGLIGRKVNSSEKPGNNFSPGQKKNPIFSSTGQRSGGRPHNMPTLGRRSFLV